MIVAAVQEQDKKPPQIALFGGMVDIQNKESIPANDRSTPVIKLSTTLPTPKPIISARPAPMSVWQEFWTGRLAPFNFNWTLLPQRWKQTDEMRLRNDLAKRCLHNGYNLCDDCSLRYDDMLGSKAVAHSR